MKMLIPNGFTIRREDRTATFWSVEWPELKANPDSYQPIGIFSVRSSLSLFDYNRIEKNKRKGKPLDPKLEEMASLAKELPSIDGIERYVSANALIKLMDYSNEDLDFLIKNVSTRFNYLVLDCYICAVGYSHLKI